MKGFILSPILGHTFTVPHITIIKPYTYFVIPQILTFADISTIFYLADVIIFVIL